MPRRKISSTTSSVVKIFEDLGESDFKPPPRGAPDRKGRGVSGALSPNAGKRPGILVARSGELRVPIGFNELGPGVALDRALVMI